MMTRIIKAIKENLLPHILIHFCKKKKEVSSVCFFCPETGQDIHSSLKFCPVGKFCLSFGQKSSQNERYMSDAISCWSLGVFLIFFFPYCL